MKSLKRLSRYTSILLSVLLMLTAVSPGITVLAAEVNDVKTYTYKDENIQAEVQVSGFKTLALPENATLTVKALDKDSQDATEKALYEETEASLNAKAAEQNQAVNGFTAYRFSLKDAKGNDVTPAKGSFTVKVAYTTPTEPEAYTTSASGQKSVQVYQRTEGKNEQNQTVYTMEAPKEENTKIETEETTGKVKSVEETKLTTLEPVTLTWQSVNEAQPVAVANEALGASVQSDEVAAPASNYDPNNPGPLSTVNTIDSTSKGVDIQMFNYNTSTPDQDWGGMPEDDKAKSTGRLSQGIVKRNLKETDSGSIRWPIR